jgi:hypothetical protein
MEFNDEQLTLFENDESFNLEQLEGVVYDCYVDPKPVVSVRSFYEQNVLRLMFPGKEILPIFGV